MQKLSITSFDPHQTGMRSQIFSLLILCIDCAACLFWFSKSSFGAVLLTAVLCCVIDPLLYKTNDKTRKYLMIQIFDRASGPGSTWPTVCSAYV
ncbi:hypothetical protein F4782DRAFT_488277 [Xylaria castorea]|nr:hypothetical protein F4782DRAFT_488277 [Xylaria castorea]